MTHHDAWLLPKKNAIEKAFPVEAWTLRSSISSSSSLSDVWHRYAQMPWSLKFWLWVRASLGSVVDAGSMLTKFQEWKVAWRNWAVRSDEKHFLKLSKQHCCIFHVLKYHLLSILNILNLAFNAFQVLNITRSGDNLHSWSWATRAIRLSRFKSSLRLPFFLKQK